jgi:hypothetical protein
MMMMVMIMIMIMTIVSVEQHPGWGDDVETVNQMRFCQIKCLWHGMPHTSEDLTFCKVLVPSGDMELMWEINSFNGQFSMANFEITRGYCSTVCSNLS